MLQYYIVPPDIVDAYQGKVKGDIGISFRQNNAGDQVVNIEVAPLWPEIDWSTMQIVQLAERDFPIDVIR